MTIFPWGCTEFPEFSMFREVPAYSTFSRFVATLLKQQELWMKREDVGTKCLRVMHPSIQLQSVYYFCSGGLQGMSLYFFVICDNDGDVDCCGGFWCPMTLTFDHFNWKLAFHLLVPWGTSIPILIFLCFSWARTRQMERRGIINCPWTLTTLPFPWFSKVLTEVVSLHISITNKTVHR